MPITYLLFFLLFLSSSSASIAYATYHLYSSGFPLTSCACSDGQYGLMTRWGYNDLSSLFPYVSAFSLSSWNSPYCGDCIQLQYQGRTVYVTVIDFCGSPPSGYDAHFDLSEEAFLQLIGDTSAGSATINWSYTGSQFCKGNRG